VLNGDVKSRVAAINAIAVRRQVSSLPILTKLIDDRNDEIKKAAFKVIGKLGGDKEFEIIAKSPVKSKEAISALETIAPRLNNKSAAANTIINLIGNNKSTLTEFINVLVALGTDECLKPISELAKSPDASSKEYCY
jgi:HEAT repeat protein